MTTLRDSWIEDARGRSLEEALVARGSMATLKRQGRGATKLAGPCPHCGGRDRFTVDLTKGVFYCRHCRRGGRDAIALVQHIDRCGFFEAVGALAGDPPDGRPETEAERAPREQRDVERRERLERDRREREAREAEELRVQHEKAGWLWSRCQPIKGTIAERYLRSARGITCPLPSTLGFLLSRKPEHHPAMIAAFALRDEIEPGVLGEPRNVKAVHLTLLKPDGSGKAEVEKPKIVVGSPDKPIVLAPPNDLLNLGITEGIEDALSVHQATGLGAWAAGSAGHMPDLADMVPGYIETITIFAHNDKAGRLGADQLAEALSRRGIEVLLEGLS